MRSHLGVLLASVVLAVAGFVLPARASSVEALDDQELVKRAERIVHADVLRITVEWDDAHTRLFTIVELSPRETLKGDAGVVTLKFPGGSRDGITTIVHGMPTFKVGEEVVVFVSSRHPKSGVCLPIGLGQGKWSCETDEKGRRVARRTLHGVHLVGKPGAPDPFARMTTETPRDELLTSVRDEVGRQRKAADKAAADANAQGNK